MLLDILEIGTPVINTTEEWCSGYGDIYIYNHGGRKNINGIIIRNDRTTSCRKVTEPLYLIEWFDTRISSKIRYQFDIDYAKMRDDKINQIIDAII
jgi:hypothetical protein